MDSIKTGSQLMKDAQIIFWDFDGVIKDSVEIKTMAFTKLFKSYGLDMMERVRQHHVANGGMSRFSKFPIYLGWMEEKATSERVHELSEQFSKLVFQGVVDCAWVPGAKEYILANKYKQIFILVSATPQEELTQIVNKVGLNLCFTRIYGAPFSKSEAINQTLDDLQIVACDALMIGDAIADFDAAKANKVDFLLRRHSSNGDLFSNYKGNAVNDFTEL